VGAVVLAVVLVSLVVYAVAQVPPGLQGGQGQGMRGFRPPGGGAAIAVAGNAVFVVANGMLLKFDAETLELLAQADLPQPEWQQMPPPPGQ